MCERVNYKHLLHSTSCKERQTLILQAKSFGFEVNESESLVIDFELVEIPKRVLL